MTPLNYTVAMKKVNLAEKFALIERPWNPRVAGEINECYVKLVKLAGEFVWHKHDAEDELFLVIKGRLRMKVREAGREHEIEINPGEFLVVPHGTEHLPIADENTEVVLLEPKATLNTGDKRNERTVEELEWI
ncbi:MAG TPA: cupin domain-containing protein [Terriglobales bacterium]|jgi:mannose-6-phosphate isomerase-like protein (cupin superfamily)|nr:cupin domain-containing protein [Terriglobales bacterium]